MNTITFPRDLTEEQVKQIKDFADTLPKVEETGWFNGQSYWTLGLTSPHLMSGKDPDLGDMATAILGVRFFSKESANANRSRLEHKLSVMATVHMAYHKHVDPLGWKYELSMPFYTPALDNSTEWQAGKYWGCTTAPFKFPNTGEGHSACTAFISECGDLLREYSLIV